MLGMVDLGRMIEEYRQEYNAVWQSLLNKGDFIRGEWIHGLERQWEERIGNGIHCVAVGSGTAALEILFKRIRHLKFAGSVLMPAVTFWATAEAIFNTGMTPILVDVDERGLIDLEDAERKLRYDTISICGVSLYGQVPDPEKMKAFAEEHSLLIVEDAAQAHGSERVGEVADYVAWSWYPAKTVGAFGDAGMIGTKSEECAAYMESLADHGRAGHNQHDLWGTNARMSTLQAGILQVQLSHLDEWCQARRNVLGWYKQHIGETPWKMLPFKDDEIPHLMIILVPSKMRDELVVCLNGMGIGARVHYPIALHQQPAWLRKYGRMERPQAEVFTSQCITLPMHPWLTEENVVHICHVLYESGRELRELW